MNSILIHPARRCAGVCVLALVAIMAFGASAQAADIELVYVSETIAIDGGILVNEDGHAYRVTKDSGCLAFSQYEGRLVLVYSPSGSINKGSEIVLLEENQRCRIVEVSPLDKSQTTPGRAIVQGLRLTRNELRGLCEIALRELGGYADAASDDGEYAPAAMVRTFQESHGIEATGELGAVTMLAIAGQLRRGYPDEPTMLAIAMLISRRASKDLGCKKEYEVELIGEGGRVVVLARNRYEVSKEDAARVSEWAKGDIVIVCSRVLFNKSTGDVVELISVE